VSCQELPLVTALGLIYGKAGGVGSGCDRRCASSQALGLQLAAPVHNVWRFMQPALRNKRSSIVIRERMVITINKGSRNLRIHPPGSPLVAHMLRR
jgi:hypothetical protein